MIALILATALAQAPASACGVSDEPSFATTKEHAVQVGGGAMYVAARERRYLDALRGPMGEVIQYRRRGSLRLDPDGETILDAYEITYPGLEKPVVFYLDAYHFDDALKAPKGFTCAVPIALNPPGPDGFVAARDTVRLAIEQGAMKEFASISLDADGSTAHGVILDHFRLVARASHAATAARAPLDPAKPAPELARTRMVIVAYPQRCGDKEPVAPAAIEIVAAQGPPPRRDGELATGEALARLVPGLPLRAGAMGAAFLLDRPRPTDTIKIAYPDGGCGAAAETALPMKYTNARPLTTPQPSLPAGQTATDRPVRLQALIDLDGALQHLVYQGGPAPLVDAAIAAARAWTTEPMRLNGAPIVSAVALQVKFGPR